MPNKKKIYSLATLISQLKLTMTGLMRKNGAHDVPDLVLSKDPSSGLIGGTLVND